jgi:LCP family protein required for cell wall assembly
MAQHGKALPGARRKAIFKWLGITAAVAVVSAGSIGGYAVWDLNHRIQENSVDIGAAPKPVKKTDNSPQVDEFDGEFTMLLVGGDDGNGEAKYGPREKVLNDVNILLHVSADHTKATAISVPRDTYVNIPQCVNTDTGATSPAVTHMRINQSLSRGGKEGGLKCVVDTFRQLTGQEIPYAAKITFDGVVSMSNAVGGVPVCVANDIDDNLSGLHLTAGEHTLSGDDALAFLRTRHGVGDGSDLGRISNQQVFLSSLMRTLKSKQTLSDPKKVYDIAHVVADNMQLSTSLGSVSTLASLAYTLKDVPLGNITFLQYPTAPASDGSEGVDPVKSSAQQMIDAVFSDKEVSITGGTAPGNIGSVKQTPTASPSPTDVATGVPTNAPSDAASANPSPSATSSAVALPKDVTGQTADESTCSRGFGDYNE